MKPRANLFGEIGPDWKPAVGLFAMKDKESNYPSLVLISEMRDGKFGVNYVQIFEREQGDFVGSGGSSFYWIAAQFSPVTRPDYFLACEAYHTQRRIAQLKADLAGAESELAVKNAAFRAVRQCLGIGGVK